MKTADDVLLSILATEGEGTFSNFRERHNPDPKVQERRRLAAVLLGRYWGDAKDERIMLKLDCSRQFVDQAHRLWHEDVKFRKKLTELGCRITPEPANAPPKPDLDLAENSETTSSEQKLRRIAKAEFGYDWPSLFVSIRIPSTARVRQMLMLIGRDYLSMTREEIAAVFDTSVSTVDQCVQIQSDYVDQDKAFRKRISDMCERNGIPFVRNRRH